MPRGRRRVRMRYVSECFTGAEAEEWLLFHLQSTAKFGTICRQQVYNNYNGGMREGKRREGEERENL